MIHKIVLARLATLFGVAPTNAAPPVAREIVNLASGLRVDVIAASNAWRQGGFLWTDNHSG